MICHVKVYGRVQGVGFRAFTRRKAEENKMTGWVRNRIDGSVEVYAEGSDENMAVFLSVLKKGPSWGRVDKITPVSIPDAPAVEMLSDRFFIAPTV